MQTPTNPIPGLIQALVSARHTDRTLSATPWMGALADAPAAYAVQDAVAHALGWFSSEVAQHWKSGGPHRQAVLTHAPLPPAGVRNSPARLADMPFHTMGVEAEIALRLGQAVSPQQAAALTIDTATELIDAMAVSIEIVDSRWQEGVDTPALLRLADQQSHGALVLGDWVAYAPRDWDAQRCVARIGAREPVLRTGTHPLGHPAWLLPVWLQHATRHGATVPSGTVVTTGTWVGILPANAGEEVVVEFEGIGSARVTL